VKVFARLLLPLALAWAAAAGCTNGGDDGGTEPIVMRPEPVLDVRPDPGTFRLLVVDVKVTSPQKGLTFYFGVDADPDLSVALSDGVKVRLTHSASVRISVRDKDGKLWGPYAYEYVLTHPVGQSYCSLTGFERYYFRPGEMVAFKVDYGFAKAVSGLYLTVDGAPRFLGAAETLDPYGTLYVDAGPFATEGPHQVACEVREPEATASDTREIAIDGTPPVAAWVTAGGAYDRASWPGEIRLHASDARSGVASVILCKPGNASCLEPEAQGGDYVYATVLTAETSLQASVQAVITDVAGNQTTLAALPLDLRSFGEPAPAAPLPVTLVTGAAFDLNAALAADGRAAAVEAASAVLAPAYDPSALPLAAGWNDFVYRQAGRSEWQSFGVYRAGLALGYPASAAPWLVFASQSTAPAMQGTLAGALAAGPAGQWVRPWFDVPHVWFVQDQNANARWDDGDALWIYAPDAHAAPLQARLAPVAGALELWAPAAPGAGAVKTVVCTDCAAGGTLFFERRATRYAYPASHSALAAVGFAAVTSATVTVWPQSGEWCTFFWDENGDGAVNGREPRSFGSCADGSFGLARQGVLGVAFGGGAVQVSGAPYGGSVTGELAVVDGATPLYRESVRSLAELNGTGAITAAVAPVLNLAYAYRVYGGGQAASVALPAVAPAQTVTVGVQDETGADVSAVAIVQRGAASFGAVFHAGGGSVAVGLPAPSNAETAWVFGLRTGYLSVATPVVDTTFTARILSPAVTGLVTGAVTDRFGYPVSHATLTWTSRQYSARALSDAQGWYALPASGGTGSLRVAADGPFVRETAFWLDVTRQTVVQNVVLADERGPGWPLGANLGIWPEEILGAYAAPVYVGDRYYAARVTSGVWVVHSSYGTSRRVSLPGALPPLAADAPRTFPLGDLGLAFLDQYARCGARLQLAVALVGAVVDSDCWGWFGADGFEEYYLGHVDPVAGFPAPKGMGVMNAYVTGAPASIELVDVLLGRRLHVPVYGGVIRASVPAGVYAVFKTGGGAANPSHVTVRATDNPTYTFVLP
jgi:hypothetical protein